MNTFTQDEIEAFLSDIPDFDYTKMGPPQKVEQNISEEPVVTQIVEKEQIKSTTKKTNQPFSAKANSNLPKINLLLDVSLETRVELGRTNISLKDILSLGEGSVIDLEKSADEPLTIFVNQRPVAKGEVVIVDEIFGIRLTEMVSVEQQHEILTLSNYDQ